MASSARRSADKGDCSAGFNTTELPADSAGAHFQVAIIEREIPRDDRTDNTQRLATHQYEIARTRRRNLVVNLVDGFRVPLKYGG